MIPLQEGVDVEPVRRIPSVMLALLRIGLAAMASLAATWAEAAVPAAARTCEAADWTVGGAGVEHPRADCAAGPVLNAGSYREVWRRDYDGLLEFPPSYAGGVLYTAMDNGWVTAQRTTGSVVWSRRFTTPWPHGPRDAHYNAIVHTPTYWNGRLYFQTKNMGRIWCLDAATGKTIWKFVNMGGEAAPIVIPTRRGPRVYAVEREGRVVVLDALTGEPIWAKQMLGHTTSALAYSDRRLFGADYDGNVIAFKRNGNVVWRRHLAFSSSYANMAVRYGRLYAVSRLGWAFSLGTGAGGCAGRRAPPGSPTATRPWPTATSTPRASTARSGSCPRGPARWSGRPTTPARSAARWCWGAASTSRRWAGAAARAG